MEIVITFFIISELCHQGFKIIYKAFCKLDVPIIPLVLFFIAFWVWAYWAMSLAYALEKAIWAPTFIWFSIFTFRLASWIMKHMEKLKNEM